MTRACILHKKFGCALLLGISLLGTSVRAFAGQSLVLTPGFTVPVNNPNLPATQAWRVEFQLHDWVLPTVLSNDTALWGLNGVGTVAVLLSTGYLRVFDNRDSGGPLCDVPLAGSNVLVRIQRDPVARVFSCELWSSDGSHYTQVTSPITTFLNWPYTGGGLGSATTTGRLGFLRAFDTLVSYGSQPPVTAGTGDLLDLKFDGNLSDTSGKKLSIQAGAFFANTPGQNPAPFIKTAGAPAWSNWVSLRAGFPAALDGSRSFSMADGSSAVTYKWQQLAGPTTLRWSSYTSVSPTISGLIFGTYRFQLQVTDAAGKAATTSLDVGAVATDDNGVVVQANPAADLIYGPMIAFGRNPWAWQDQMTIHAATVRAPELAAISPPSWVNALSGTITYTPASASQAAQTPIRVALNAGDMTISVTDQTTLDLTTLPTLVLVHAPNAWTNYEVVRICSASANVLTVCYNGRGWRASAVQSWPAGSTVRQIKTTGTGTTFLTDFCPAGPGEEGQISYSAGTIGVAANSATATGSGTAWTDPPLQGQRIRIQGTHSGAPFIFFATVAVVKSTSSITLSRPWPADADTAQGLTYAIVQPTRSIVRQWRRSDGTNGQEEEGVSGCENDTSIYHENIFSSIPTGTQTSQRYSQWNSFWFSDFGPNYYDEVLGEYAGYLRSGHNLFLSNARTIGDYWARSPDFDEGYIGVSPRRVGATGLVAGAVLDGRTSNWPALRKLAANASVDPNVIGDGKGNYNCDADLRETAYELSWISLAALFDPIDTGSTTTPNQRSYWKAQLAKAFVRDNACKGPHSEFPSAYFSATVTPLTMTNGSRIVTGTNIPATLCPVVGTGTLTVVNGSVTATGTGFVTGPAISISMLRNGQPALFRTFFTVNSPTSITMQAAFDGDPGTYTWYIDDGSPVAFANYNADHQSNPTKYYTDMNYPFDCIWNSSTQITIDRNWPSASGTGYAAYRYGEIGYGQEVFFDGVKTFAMKYASLAATGDTAANYAALSQSTAAWVLSTGFDPVTGGLHYAREWGICEPNENPRLGCTYATDASSRQSSRTLNGEAQNAMRVAYEANPAAQVKAFGDEFYGAQWGKLGGPYSDDVYLSNIENDNTWSYKWLGFLFGIGMSHQWPAVRLGGVQPAVPSNPAITFDLGSVAGAVSARITVTQPSSATTAWVCTTSPCSVTVDQRQGAHWYVIEYLDAGGAVLSRSTPDLLAVSPNRNGPPGR